VVEDRHYWFAGSLGDGGLFMPAYDPARRPRTQDIPPRFRENGAVYVMTRAQIMERGCRMGGRMLGLVMRSDESIDVDEPADLAVCDALLRGAHASPP
jgi:N-acylneuraminate cytidylyltransferase/CMP-N,N'-diacetyllegionaminic acid synthase